MLAYSGGLDTSIIIPWLKEHYDNCEVIAVCGNVGQKGELEGLEERAKASGASKLYIEDLTDEFVEDYVIPTMQAGAVYEDGYLLGTSFARPLIAKRLVEIAKKEKADAIVHGCTVGDNVLIGMGATVLNGAKIGDNCIVGAGALVTGKMDAPAGSMILGSPAKVVRPLTEAEIESNRESAREYCHQADRYRED